VVAAEVQTEPTKILLQQIDQILMSCSRRAAHEIAWIYEEADRIAAETGRNVGHPDSLHLDDMVAWYDAASRVLSEEVEAAFRSGDEARIAKLKAVLDTRSAVEMQILGALELVGRG
jgi:hypothetical protein